jgi:alcohol dehydrogenase class IV
MLNELQAATVAFEVFSDICPNPRDFQVMAGATRYHQSHCSGLVAIGGGSPMDCAKGIGMVVSCGGNIREFEGIDQVPRPCPPMMFVPTTSGTAADVSQFAIVTDTTRRKKMAIVSKATLPDVSLTDPEVTVTMPPDLTKYTGLDALTHAIESLVSNAHSQLTQLHSLEAIRLVFEQLPAAVANGSTITPRIGMSTASLLAGFAFSNASLGLVHAMAHALGGRFDLPHGLCNALLLPYVLEYNVDACKEELANAASVIGSTTHQQFVTQVWQLVEDLIGSVKLRSVGITEDSLSVLTRLPESFPLIQFREMGREWPQRSRKLQ